MTSLGFHLSFVTNWTSGPVLSSEEVPFRASEWHLWQWFYIRRQMWPDAFSEWNPPRSQKLYLLQLCPLESFLSMNPFPLSNLPCLSGDLTFLNYTQSSCVTALISVCLPSVLLFLNADMCYCLSTMCHQFTTTNSVKWKSGQGEIYFRHFCSTSFYSSPHANHTNSEQGSKTPNKIMFWLLTDIFNGLFHSPFGKPHPVLGFTGKRSCWKSLQIVGQYGRWKLNTSYKAKKKRKHICLLMLHSRERSCIIPILSSCVLNVRNIMLSPEINIHTHCERICHNPKDDADFV